MKKLAFLITLFCSCFAYAQNGRSGFEHVEPPNWWVGMQNPSVQIMFYDKDLDLSSYEITTTSADTEVKEVVHPENSHYVFVTLSISSARAGIVKLVFKAGKKSFEYSYELKAKGGSQKRIQGFDSKDVVYLIMPDRFANGNAANDSVKAMLEGAHRDKPFGRHGGDLAGIQNHLDYLKDLGITALWLNPVLENNQKRSSYHGYSFTDMYKVDPRFGSNDDYVRLINAAHDQGIKVIQDMVANHIGSDHWMMRDLPEKSWVHQFPKFTQSSFKAATASDPYGAPSDVTANTDGWFAPTMPDLNQNNPLLATYLIQNSLWWIEYAGIDGIRMDTYPFNDKLFMERWAKTITKQYPSFSIVGEVWMNSISHTSYWAKDARNNDGFESGLPSVTDFPFCFSVAPALKEKSGDEAGLAKLYNLLSQDFKYPDANRNLTFLDNHDMTRFFLSVDRDLNLFKMGIAFLLTTRGIPQLYYGTELLMDGDGNSHPEVRKDFPGGWNGDPLNAFTASGRSAQQNEAFNFIRTLLQYRKSNPVISNGRLMQYVPKSNVYVYFRYDDRKLLMVAMNGNTEKRTIETDRFNEIIHKKTNALNIITGDRLRVAGSLDIPAKGVLILELTD